MKVKVGARDGPKKIKRCATDVRKLVGKQPALDAADELLHSRNSQSGAGPVGPQNPPSAGPVPARASVPAGSAASVAAPGTSTGEEEASEGSGADVESPSPPAPGDSGTGQAGRWCQTPWPTLLELQHRPWLRCRGDTGRRPGT